HGIVAFQTSVLRLRAEAYGDNSRGARKSSWRRKKTRDCCRSSIRPRVVETIFHIQEDDSARPDQFTWLRIRHRDASSGNAWDKAYALLNREPLLNGDVVAFEPDFEQR